MDELNVFQDTCSTAFATADISDPWNKLDDAMVESVLARLSSSLTDIVCCASVSKRWNSIIFHSSAFAFAANQFVDRRLPWIFMVPKTPMSTFVVYDIEKSKWRHLPHGIPEFSDFRTPVAASDGLVCITEKYCVSLVKESREFYCPPVIMNPFTGVSRDLPKLDDGNLEIIGMAMYSSKVSSASLSNYKVFSLFIGNGPQDVHLKVFSSGDLDWSELPLKSEVKVDDALELIGARRKIKSGITTLGNEGQIIVNFFDKKNRKFHCFDTQKGTYFVSPSLTSQLGHDFMLSLQVVKCGERVFVVGLERARVHGSKSKKLKIWDLDMGNVELEPLLIASKNVGGKVDTISSSGHGNYAVICVRHCRSLNLNDDDSVVMYNLKDEKWTTLPKCYHKQDKYRLVTFKRACCFVPDIHVKA